MRGRSIRGGALLITNRDGFRLRRGVLVTDARADVAGAVLD